MERPGGKTKMADRNPPNRDTPSISNFQLAQKVLEAIAMFDLSMPPVARVPSRLSFRILPSSPRSRFKEPSAF